MIDYLAGVLNVVLSIELIRHVLFFLGEIFDNFSGILQCCSLIGKMHSVLCGIIGILCKLN